MSAPPGISTKMSTIPEGDERDERPDEGSGEPDRSGLVA